MPRNTTTEKPYDIGLVWLRRDLRTHDHAALHRALRACRAVHVAFVFDRDILEPLPRRDRRVEFIRESLVEVDESLRALGGSAGAEGAEGVGLIVLHDRARTAIPALALELGAEAVFIARDYEQTAIARDEAVRTALSASDVALHVFKDQTIFEAGEILTQAGKPFAMYAPFKRAWLAKLDDYFLKAYPIQTHAAALAPRPAAHRRPVPTLEAIGFEKTNLSEVGIPTGMSGGARLFGEFESKLDAYGTARDFPAERGTSYLSVHLRHGTVSIRGLASRANARWRAGSEGAGVWLSEFIWRDFYFQILAAFAHVSDTQGRSHSFNRAHDQVRWLEGPEADARFAAWCEARTGYPLVDAAMRQINATGFMHNRLRMVTAVFLCKDLGIDWRRGEAYFARHLNDFDLSANNGGWQWSASSGSDAQPYFRIFNPVSQSERFDPDGEFIARYLPVLAKLPAAARHAPWTAKPGVLEAAGVVLGRDYPRPVVDHAEARVATMARYAVLKRAKAEDASE